MRFFTRPPPSTTTNPTITTAKTAYKALIRPEQGNKDKAEYNDRCMHLDTMKMLISDKTSREQRPLDQPPGSANPVFATKNRNTTISTQKI
jgi:hypothetical protein